ncbi:RNA polymerase subunit sigma [Paenibacillus sp. J31TS4]|uniref:RNA polymerase sigma factor n=1 Tax=Paenibacillus sp. J31TS4 TaxID=2807195 RepID=UPI001B0BE5AF|nr:sigma-70 family RNA polymerase sigma factor [Paenibacillus sp. J31TS4]GIP38456.1 RNA polymerase subunit sigma [Paenibacillus sp. J31TS4]
MELEELYPTIQPRIYAFFYVKTLSREAAEDLTQDVFYEAWKGAASFSGRSTVQTWLFGIAKNKLSHYYRSKRYKADLAARLAPDRSESATPEEQVIAKEGEQRLLAAIRELDPVSREIVELRIYGELSFKEIGELVGESENVARVRFHRAKLRLHRELGGYDGQ